MAEQEQKAEESTQVSFRCLYYSMLGRGGPIRLAAFLGGVAFEDEFFTGEQHYKEKAEGKRRWSGPPELTVYDKDGKELTKIAQSNACIRFAASLGGLYPEDPVQRALNDEILDSIEDCTMVMMPAYLEKDAEKKAALMAELLKADGKLTYWFKKLEARLDENEKRGNKSGLFVADSIGIADLKAFCGLDGLFKQMPDYFKQFPRLTKCYGAVGADERVKAFLEQFDKNVAAYKENAENNVFQYAGKFVPSTFSE